MKPVHIKQLLAVAVALIALGAIWWYYRSDDDTGVRLQIDETLAEGDSSRPGGELYDEHSFEGRMGEPVTITLASSDFDPYLVVTSPSGDRVENDDLQLGDWSPAQVELTLLESGTYSIQATSFRKGETGDYSVRVRVGDRTTALADGLRGEIGTLGGSDAADPAEKFQDEYAFEGRRGEQVTVDLRSRAFDPVVVVTAPGGDVTTNDDYNGDGQRALVSFALPEDGRYRVIVTTYAAGQSGDYDLLIDQRQGGGARAQAGPRVEMGSLTADDRTVARGGFYDEYTVAGVPGRRLRLEMTSSVFDTYLILVPPRGAQIENDDTGDDVRRSVIEADLTESGEYRVLATSYAPQTFGSYELRIEQTELPAAPYAPLELPVGRLEEGVLATTDGKVTSGSFADFYSFEGTEGENIVVDLQSNEFDTFLSVTPPEGAQIDNDDVIGLTGNSRISLTLTRTGRYRVAVSSYQVGATGRYRLSLRRVAAPPPRAGGPSGTGGRIYGVFVGISDYSNRQQLSNLLFTANDARAMHASLVRGAGMAPEDGTILTDSQATVEGVRAAVESTLKRVGPDDVFVLFYSGHGGRVQRPRPAPSDPDGVDETLVLYDQDVRDDTLAEWLESSRARVTLVVLDSCFSGGFSKDVINAPGRMGLFSSHEDVLSSVAFKFLAGGYLAHFFGQAVGERLGDLDGNGNITAVELSQFLLERFRADVKSSAKSGDVDDFVQASAGLGYQHLVVDRGGVGPYDVLFSLTRCECYTRCSFGSLWKQWGLPSQPMVSGGAPE